VLNPNPDNRARMHYLLKVKIKSEQKTKGCFEEVGGCFELLKEIAMIHILHFFSVNSIIRWLT
jgi:hypothetical protein